MGFLIPGSGVRFPPGALSINYRFFPKEGGNKVLKLIEGSGSPSIGLLGGDSPSFGDGPKSARLVTHP